MYIFKSNQTFHALWSAEEINPENEAVLGLKTFLKELPQHKLLSSIFIHQSHVEVKTTLTLPISDVDSIFNKLLGLLSDNNSLELLIFNDQNNSELFEISWLCFSASTCNWVIFLSESCHVAHSINVSRASAYLVRESHQSLKVSLVSENKDFQRDLTNVLNQLETIISHILWSNVNLILKGSSFVFLSQHLNHINHGEETLVQFKANNGNLQFNGILHSSS